MISAQEWVEYQGSYARYGFDMKPRVSVEKKTARRTVVNGKRLVAFILVVGLICTCMIVSTAYAASIAYANNTIQKEINMLQGEVDSLSIKLKSATNIETIEKKAIEQLGMVYPREDQFIEIAGQEAPGSDFAALLKQAAYN